jgi:murein DD-endopeptidase MepM/ murein hydrolase activator NlpD
MRRRPPLVAVFAIAVSSAAVPALVMSSVTAPVVQADESDDAAQRAAREIADARERANAAADAMFQAESDLDTLQLEQEALRVQVDLLQQRVDALRATVETVAIDRFTRSGSDALPLLTGFEQANDLAQADVLIDVVNDTSADTFDEFDALSLDLAEAQSVLEESEAATEQARDRFEQLRENALAEVEFLKEMEEQRLKDEAVRKALEAEEARRRALAEALARAEAEAQRDANVVGAVPRGDSGQASPPPAGNGAGSGGSDSSGGDSGGSGSGGDQDQGSDDDIDAPATPQAPTTGVGGGQTGTGGAGGRPGANPGDIASGSWVCPVQGAVAFGDTWGAPRSGGRTHQGVDMIGARGLPIIAVVDGFAQQRVNRLGGNSIWLTGADGNKYYYAHLDDWATLGQVSAGTVIGYMGDTGNAKYSTVHLHFEIHPGGGPAVNPYPTVRAHC